MKRLFYQELAGRFTAYNNCVKSNNQEWEDKHLEVIEKMIGELPHGSGIDGETFLRFADSKDDRLIIKSSYHVMDENGYYDSWINFSIILTPSLQFGLYIDIRGNFGKHQDLKNYLIDVFSYVLNGEIEIGKKEAK